MIISESEVLCLHSMDELLLLLAVGAEGAPLELLPASRTLDVLYPERIYIFSLDMSLLALSFECKSIRHKIALGVFSLVLN